MKNALFSTVLFGAFALQIQAQTQFQKVSGSTANDRNYHLTAMQDGGFVSTGYTNAVTGNLTDAFLVKYNRFGVVEWAKTYGDTGDETMWDVINTQSNHIVGVGYSSSLGLPVSAGVISKTDNTGNIVWSKGLFHLGGTTNLYRVIETSNGELLAAGLTVTNNQEDFFICKFNANGVLLWTKVYGTPQDDEFMGICETSDGNYLFAGLTSDANGNGSSEFAAMKTDTAGNLIWLKRYGGSGGDRLNSVLEVNNAYYFLGWSPEGAIGNADFTIMKTDTAGVVDWTRAYGSPLADRAYNFMYDSTSNALMVGGYTDYSDPNSNNRNTVLMSVALNGNMNWAKSYGLSQTDGHWPTGLARNNDKGYYLLASTNSTGPGNYSFYLIKTDEDGNTSCNQKNPAFTQSNITNFTGVSFGASVTLALTDAPLTVTGANWVLTTSNLCCSLYADSLANHLLCPGDSVVLTSTPVSGYQYNWMKNGNPISSTNQISVDYQNPGSYSLMVSAQGSGCSNTSRTAVVNSDTSLQALNIARNQFFCQGDTFSIVLPSSAVNYNWYSLSQQQVVFVGDTFSTQLTDSFAIERISINQCLFSDTLVIVEVFSPLSDTLIKACNGDTVFLEAPQNHPHVWLHDSLNTNKIIGVNQSAVYNLKITVQHCEFINAFEVNYFPYPDTHTITSNGDLLTSSISNASTYQWFLNGNPIAGANQQSYFAWQSGMYTVLAEEPGTACTSLSEAFNHTFTHVANHQSESKFKVYPNPTHGNFTLQFWGEPAMYSIAIIGLSGAELHHNEKRWISANESLIYSDLQLSKGIYFIQLTSDRQVFVEKLIVE